MTRRKFLSICALAVPAAAGVDGRWIEPTALQTTRLNLGTRHQFVHFTDLHYKGDREYAAAVIERINELPAEFVCFSGDLVEERRYAAEALTFIRQIKAPVYGAPGNHDYWSGADFAEYERVFAATGGAWLVDRSTVLPGELEIAGFGWKSWLALGQAKAKQRIALMHYPLNSRHSDAQRVDLMLAGHSHGGQVRLPFFGAPIVPYGVGPYQLGYYDTPAGPMYVNAGIGTYRLPIRINCRPEITLVTI